ncbi:MAG: hypothetical protein KDL31_08440 [Kiritimatiellae bacterium]|nr:hypothetical protein [Kiritimatiellia bacterium]
MKQATHDHALRGLLMAAVWLALTGCQPPLPVEKAPAQKAVSARKPAPLADYGGEKILMMHYMPWYRTKAVRGFWGSHWTGHNAEHNPDQIGEDGLPDIWSHYHPLIGLYDSTDPDVLECHLLQMKLAGIDGVIADWYGIAGVADFPEIHDATRALFDAARINGMTFAACYEDRTIQLQVEWGKLEPDQIPQQLAETFRWMEDNWFSHAHYQQFLDRPLVLNFGPIYVRDPAPWNAARNALSVKPVLFGLHHIWRLAGGDGGFTWVHHEPFQDVSSPETIRTRIGEVFSYFSKNPDEVIVSAYPGFNDVYTHERHQELAYRDGKTLEQTLEVGMAGPWKMIQLVTWNDYGEGTMIEPTHEFGYRFLEIVQDARRQEQGASFRYTHEDLRLPARLLDLRRTGNLDRSELDAIADHLARGQTPEARRLLDRLEAAR